MFYFLTKRVIEMLSTNVFTTQKLTIDVSDQDFTLAAPDIFSGATSGDVFCFDLSLEISSPAPQNNGVLRVSIVNSYTDNEFSSTQIIDLAQDPDENPLFFRFTPVIFTVISDGVNPLDKGAVHMRIDLLSGSVTNLNVVAKAIWSQVNRVDL